jgi:hypothetical protein
MKMEMKAKPCCRKSRLVSVVCHTENNSAAVAEERNVNCFWWRPI